MLASYSPHHRPSAAPSHTRRDVNHHTDDDGCSATAPPLLVVQTLAELLEADSQPSFVVPSFSQRLDLLLGGGGVAAGTVTEFCGAPGAGKTQVCLQFAASASLPVAFGGPGGSAIIVDTEGSFVAGRLREIAAAAATHVQLIANHQQHTDDADELRSGAAEYTVESIMQRTLIERITDVTGLVAFVTALPSILQIRSDIRLVIVDSIAFPFRAAEDDTAAMASASAGGSSGGGASWDAGARRTRLLVYIARELHRIAKEKNVAVILTNQVQHSRAHRTGEVKVAPALGDAWQHAISNRYFVSVDLSRQMDQPQRLVTTLKSSRALPGDACSISIVSSGVRDTPVQQSFS